jgi:glycosyltransferase involved in cell wall biosynthesis
LWDRIVLVSDWQANRYFTAFGLKPEQTSVIRNCIAPEFENSSRATPYFFNSDRPPVLIYTSTPFRGLEVLLQAFPLIRAQIPGCKARIFSSLEGYQKIAENELYRALYERCVATEGIDYIGSVGQDVLAVAMNEADVFAYPNTFLETSCIALMEAMASGCLIVASRYGALPETAAGFGHLCDLPAAPAQFAERYASFMVEVVREARQNPQRLSARLDEQREFALNQYAWSRRAAEWEALLQIVSRQQPRLSLPRRNDPCPCGSSKRFKHCCGSIA